MALPPEIDKLQGKYIFLHSDGQTHYQASLEGGTPTTYGDSKPDPSREHPHKRSEADEEDKENKSKKPT